MLSSWARCSTSAFSHAGRSGHRAGQSHRPGRAGSPAARPGCRAGYCPPLSGGGAARNTERITRIRLRIAGLQRDRKAQAGEGKAEQAGDVSIKPDSRDIEGKPAVQSESVHGDHLAGKQAFQCEIHPQWDTQVPRQSVARTFWNDPHLCGSMQERLGDFIYCSVASDGDDLSEPIGDSLCGQGGGMAGPFREGDDAFSIVFF